MANSPGYFSDYLDGLTTAADPTEMQESIVNLSRLSNGIFFNFTSLNTFNLRTAVGRTDRNGIIAISGPSTAAGQSTGLGTAQAKNAPSYKLADALNAIGINAGADNFFGDHGAWGQSSSVANYLTGDDRLAFNGAATVGTVTGPGGQMFQMAAAGSLVFTPVKAWTKAIVYYRDAGTGRNFNVVAGAASAVAVNGGATNTIKSVVVAASSLAIQALTINWVLGTVIIVGAHCYDDTNGRTELAIYNWGVSGNKSSQPINDTDFAASPIKALRDIPLDAFFSFDWPVNDWRGIGGSVSIAQSKANRLALGQACQTYSREFYLITPNWDGGVLDNAANQSLYAASDFEIGAQLKTPVTDYRKSTVSYTLANARGLKSDDIHPSNFGNVGWAKTIRGCIMQALNS